MELGHMLTRSGLTSRSLCNKIIIIKKADVTKLEGTHCRNHSSFVNSAVHMVSAVSRSNVRLFYGLALF